MNPNLQSDAGYAVTALCPHCRKPATVYISLITLLKQTSSKSRISVVLTQDPADHTCGQELLDLDDEVEMADELPIGAA